MTTRPTAVICTPLELEYRAVRDLLGGTATEEQRRDSIYELFDFRGRKAEWRLVLALTGRGNAETSAAVERALAAWEPQVLLLVGVGGGLRSSEVGDVVAATKVYGYEGGQDTDLEYLPRIDSLPTSAVLDEQAKRVGIEGTWIWRAEPEADTAPAVHHRPIASGGKVVTGSTSYTAELIRQHCGDATAIDMEGFGAMAAARKARGVEATVIRGISDRLHDKDKETDKQTQPMAARRAGAFALALLDRYDPEPVTPVPPAPRSDTTFTFTPNGDMYTGSIGSHTNTTIGSIGPNSTGHVHQPYRHYEEP
ncbi:5'-methylthioadenosine/S-adenosylhomocysteine nucleosidase family protein [Glycomyces dulcitolivorans]|jgi:adenosylhomocysteine nucleosidase|uniref:5'-methylthioadenosine/S-adenosylhomocysteine nucleosidase family protein n=1 Tax=Glycomyces dulcitolivorans TaxID=2200759 RepID=UPI000DD4AFF4|nr:phosphorylase [Glycomyces dulcitolivorans]